MKQELSKEKTTITISWTYFRDLTEKEKKDLVINNRVFLILRNKFILEIKEAQFA